MEYKNFLTKVVPLALSVGCGDCSGGPKDVPTTPTDTDGRSSGIDSGLTGNDCRTREQIIRLGLPVIMFHSDINTTPISPDLQRVEMPAEVANGFGYVTCTAYNYAPGARTASTVPVGADVSFVFELPDASTISYVDECVTAEAQAMNLYVCGVDGCSPQAAITLDKDVHDTNFPTGAPYFLHPIDCSRDDALQ